MSTTNVVQNGLSIPVTKDLASLYNHFTRKASTSILEEYATDLMVKVFSAIYLKDLADYYRDEKISRSNWTYHTANTFFRTCQTLGLLCDFEVENRHDGAIRDHKGNVYLCAEWEYEAKSILKEKGEIQKLYNTCKKHKNCSALLFTYKVDLDYREFADEIYTLWNSLLKADENFMLYFVTALMKKDDVQNINFVYGLRTLIFGKGTVEIWDDYEY